MGSVYAVRILDLERLLRALVSPETVYFIEHTPMCRGKMNLLSTEVVLRNFGRIDGVLAWSKAGWILAVWAGGRHGSARGGRRAFLCPFPLPKTAAVAIR